MNPEERRLAEVNRDGDGYVECDQERHLNQEWQTTAKRIPFLHQTQLLHLQLFQARVVLLHSLDLLLQLLHPRREFLRLLHGLGRAPLEREEKHVDDDGEENDGEAVTARQLVQVLD